MMRITTTVAFSALLLSLMPVAPALAADKEQRQMMADLRILQEQSQQLQNQLQGLLASLTESIKALSQRLDDQATANRKAFADQKLVIDNASGDLRVLREKVDENNVRVGSIGQELDALRQSVAALNAPRPFGLEADASSGGAPTGDTAQVPPLGGAGAVGASPQKLLDGAMADYYGGQFDLAILGLDSYIKNFPQSPQADYAQYHVGASYMLQANYEKAIEAYTVVIKNYPKSSFAPDAYVKLGQAHKTLKQLDKAKEAFEYVVKNYPDTVAATIAQQNLSAQKP